MCERDFTREDNFKYHSRTCDFKTTGTKRRASHQQGSGVKRVILDPPQPGDPVKIGIELTNGDVGAAVTEMNRIISKREPMAQFYLSLHVKYTPIVGSIILTTTPGNNIQHHYKQLSDKLEVNESRGWSVEDFLRLDLHIPSEHISIEDHGQALNGTLQDFSISLEEKKQTVESIYEVLSDAIYRYRSTIAKKLATKIYMSLHVNFHQSSDPSFISDPPIVLNTKPVEILASTNISEVLTTFYSSLMESIDNFELQGSGWVLDQLLRLDLCVLKYDPLRASTYLPLPEKIRYKGAVINIKNSDKLCFLWSVIAGIYGDPDDLNPSCVTHYRKYQHEFKIDGIDMPMALKDIPKFEHMNDISISVYGFEAEKQDEEGEKEVGFIYPLKITREVADRHVNLLFLSSDDISHYCLIKNFSRFVRSQVTKHKNTYHFCRFCLHGFIREDLLNEHQDECFVHGGQKTVFPKNTVVEFVNVAKQLKAPFVVYADFESLLEAVDIKTAKTNKYQHHTACSYKYHIVSDVPGVSIESKLYVGRNAAEHFLDSLERELKDTIMPIINNKVDMIFDDAAREKFEAATHCHICEKPLDPNVEEIVRDHCHFTGKFRGTAHSNCNLAYQINATRYKLPIFFHNLRGYDAHLIMQAVSSKHTKIDVIPNNFERYISFSIGRLKFLDSMQFLSCSLADLTKNLKDEDFVNLRRAFPVQYKLLSRKGVYPYDYMDGFERFEETRLPSKDRFYSRLNEEEIGEEDYAHAQRVWHSFGCTTMRDYHDLYLKADVLLLADIFEKFREMSLHSYGLDPVHYYSLPGLSWDAALKYSRVKLDLIVDIDMYQLVESGIRGGVSMISHRYAEASTSRSLIYLDANSLYSWAMSQPLPVGDFQWCDDTAVDVTRIDDDAEYGYILEVDLAYPTHLHDAHNDYPLAPEKMIIARTMLSPYQIDNFPETRGCEKLVPNLRDKSKYVLHYRNLKLYLELGMKLTKIYRTIKFRQSAWLKTYIDLNINKRKEATKAGDKVGKDMYKLFCNAVFGKTMENVRKRVNIELVTDAKIAKKRIAKPNFKRAKRFHDELIGVHLQKAKLELSRPIQAGFTILDLSKLHMYKFHYNVWMMNFAKSTLLFTDTDSLCYAVEGVDIVEGMARISNEFDFSEYPTKHPLFSQDNMKVVGKFKDELHGRSMLKFVGLRPKLYSYVCEEDRGEVVEKNTAKGVKKKVKNTKLTFADYEQSLRTLNLKSVSMNTIRSDRHRIYTQTMNKIGLSAFDDKRYICEDGVRTYAHGHWRVI